MGTVIQFPDAACKPRRVVVARRVPPAGFSIGMDILARIAGLSAQIEALTWISVVRVGTTEVVSGGAAERVAPDRAAARVFELIEERDRLLVDYGRQWRIAKRAAHALRIL